jgi:hypothetical protein
MPFIRAGFGPKGQRIPTTGIAGDCARAKLGQRTDAPPRKPMDARRHM